jgi:subtilisin
MPFPDRTPGEQPGSPPPSPRGRPHQGTRRDKPSAAGVSGTGTAGRESQPGEGAEHQQPRRGGHTRRGSGSRPERYLVAAAAPATAHMLSAQLGQDPQITVVRTIARPTAAGSGYLPIAVIETTAERAAALARQPSLYVEPDQRLGWDAPPDTASGRLADVAVAPVGEIVPVAVEVTDDAGRPVADAAVCLLGRGLPAVGFTGGDGHAELAVPAETASHPAVLSARPARGCWPARVIRPRLVPGEPAVVVCERVVTTFPDFPERALDSWGARAMSFDRLPPTHRGDGVKIAVVDSGAAAGHPDLTGRIADGRDVVGEDDKSWREDPIGSGTHQAVLIGGRDDDSGVVGLAPEAELHICRTAPGGHCADLIEALDYCIDQAIDVAVISVGITGASRLLASKVQEALHSGVACIAAAGDGAGPVGHPAALPGVLAVGAIGRLGTFPPHSGLAAQLAGPPTPGGFYVPRFSSQGPGIDCCAPGLAIVSGLPPASYGPLGGTATAAAHVAAVAALVLAHHPHFRPESGRPRANRDATRVQRLHQLILESCQPLPELGLSRTGAGIPDAAVALGIAPWGGTYSPVHGSAPHPGAASALRTPGEVSEDALAPLEAAMRSAGLIPDPGPTP